MDCPSGFCCIGRLEMVCRLGTARAAGQAQGWGSLPHDLTHDLVHRFIDVVCFGHMQMLHSYTQFALLLSLLIQQARLSCTQLLTVATLLYTSAQAFRHARLLYSDCFKPAFLIEGSTAYSFAKQCMNPNYALKDRHDKPAWHLVQYLVLTHDRHDKPACSLIYILPLCH